MSVASLSEHAKQEKAQLVLHCLACGKQLEAALSMAGSLRCLDCRAAEAPLNPQIVALWQKRGSNSNF
jgi:hypothetical protein